MKSELSNNTGGLFLTNCKQYIRLELNIFFENQEAIQDFGLLLFMDVLIHEPSIPTISDSARSILANFPTWTAMYEDSLEKATPELSTPSSVAGRFLNSLIGDHLDKIDTELTFHSLDAFINTADEDSIDWIYTAYNVPAAAISITGDSVPLARSGTLNDFFAHKKTDYVYYHNLLDSQIVTLRKFEILLIDGVSYNQEPTLLFNEFDEFGARVGLKRLYLENNVNYKQRILDVYQNVPSADIEGLKRVLRRELDIWRAYGSTPDSNYFGATPEILEIIDIESSTPYVTFDKNANKKLFDFVKLMNEKYPSNFGYSKWDESMWDSAGINYEGVNTIPFSYDTNKATGDYFQPGVGDLEDAMLFIENDSFATVAFEGYFKADGLKVSSHEDVYAPIKIIYEYFNSYNIETVHNPDASNPNSLYPDSNGGVNLVYEVSLKAHNQYATPSTVYHNFSYLDRDDFIVKNYYSQDSKSSPEYNLIKVFNSDGLSDSSIEFFEKIYGYKYINAAANPVNTFLQLGNINSVKLVANAKWNQETQQYENVTNASYRVAFNQDPSVYQVNPSFGTELTMASPSLNYVNANFKIGSTVYGTKSITGYTDPIQDEIYINKDNDISSIDDEIIIIDDLKNNTLNPIGAVPQYLYIRNVKVEPSPLYGIETDTTEFKNPEYGGTSYDPYSETEYFIPSSPNISINIYDTSDASGTPVSSNYFQAATINYSSSNESIRITTGTSATPYYPFKKPIWSEIAENEVKSTPMIFGYIDMFGSAYEQSEKLENSGKSPEPNNIDSHVAKYNLNRNSFGIPLSQYENYIITEINPVSLNDEVILSSSKNFVKSNVFSPNTLIDSIEEEFDPSINNWKYSPISVDAKLTNTYDNKTISIFDNKDPSIKTGWVYLSDNEYYIYAKPILDVYNGQFFELNLSSVPTQGAPIIVTVFDNGKVVNYKELFFNDSSTPGNVTFYNEETLYGSNDKSLYLAYPNISNIQMYIEDLFNGRVLINDPLNPEFWVWSFVDQDGNYVLDLNDDGQYYLSFLTYIQSGDDIYYLVGNRFQILNSITQQSEIIPGREYKIRYKVDDAFYVERNDKKLYFSSTPSEPSLYNVTYESSEFLSSTPSGVSLSVIDNPIEEGYVFISDNEYDFNTASIWISPYSISSNSDDFVYVTIVSHDTYGNPKPNQTFRIHGNYLEAEQEFLTTNNNGFAKTIVRYIGGSSSLNLLLNIDGVSYPSSGAHVNSQSELFSQQFNIDLVDRQQQQFIFKAIADKINIKANRVDEIYIKGYVRSNNTPPENSPVIYWRKARTAYEAINDVAYLLNTSVPGSDQSSGYVLADELGEFKIGPFLAQDRTQPGLWFVAVETEMSSVPSATPVTIYGDVVYWFEGYDNIHYSNEPVPLPRFYTTAPLTGDDIILEPRFKIRHSDGEYEATPSIAPSLNWTPPKWFPISRYNQYQMGILGSTPNLVSTYENMYIDYEDS